MAAQSTLLKKEHIQAMHPSDRSFIGKIMERLAIIFIMFVVARPALGEIAPDNPPIRHVTDCINYAIERNEIRKIGEALQFNCFHSTARDFYNYLNHKETFTKTFKAGKYQLRYTNNVDEGLDYCYQMIEDAEGNAIISRFGCKIELPLGPFINE